MTHLLSISDKSLIFNFGEEILISVKDGSKISLGDRFVVSYTDGTEIDFYARIYTTNNCFKTGYSACILQKQPIPNVSNATN